MVAAGVDGAAATGSYFLVFTGFVADPHRYLDGSVEFHQTAGVVRPLWRGTVDAGISDGKTGNTHRLTRAEKGYILVLLCNMKSREGEAQGICCHRESGAMAETPGVSCQRATTPEERPET